MTGWIECVPILLGLVCLGTTATAGAAGETTKGFVDKVYRAPGGAQVKYVVFVPHDYDGTKPFPVILYLHGSGSTGTDGRDQIGNGLANAIRKREKTFPFIAVFPQSHAGSWQAGSEDGRRAVAILDVVLKSYNVDTRRVYLTGVSMGGEGTWSLAAAYPDRWAAIVPICGGGDTKTAARFKDIPCWCFHGDADQPEIARAMIRALKRAGGQPLYHEYAGVGHNCWDLAYASDDLYEWLLLQKTQERTGRK
jgi:predicted peptidase